MENSRSTGSSANRWDRRANAPIIGLALVLLLFALLAWRTLMPTTSVDSGHERSANQALPRASDEPADRQGPLESPTAAGSSNASSDHRTGAPVPGAWLWAVEARHALASVAAAEPGDPDAIAWHRDLQAYCQAELLAMSDADRIDRLARANGRIGNVIPDDTLSRDLVKAALVEQRRFCGALGPIPSLEALWGKNWQSQVQGDKAALHSWLQAGAGASIETRRQIVDSLGGDGAVWEIALTGDSLAIRTAAMALLVGSDTGPFANIEQIVDRAWRAGTDPDTHVEILQHTAGEVFLCRTLPHCSPAGLKSRKLVASGYLDARAGYEIYLRRNLSPRDWEAVERLVARMVAASQHRAKPVG